MEIVANGGNSDRNHRSEKGNNSHRGAEKGAAMCETYGRKCERAKREDSDGTRFHFRLSPFSVFVLLELYPLMGDMPIINQT